MNQILKYLGSPWIFEEEVTCLIGGWGGVEKAHAGVLNAENQGGQSQVRSDS